MSRILLIALGVVIGMALLILLGVNMYVQSRGTQARIQQELSQRLGMNLRIQRISVTPWWGLKLTGITIPQTQPEVSSDFLTAKTFRLRIRFSSLFSGHLVIKEVSLVNAEVVWAQNANGKWRVPSQPPPKPAITETPVAAPPPAEQSAIAPEPAVNSAPPTVVVPTEDKAGYTPEVERVNVIRARFRFLDEKLKSVATFEDVDFRSGFRSATDLRGNITIARTSLRDRFFLQELHSPLRYDANELDFSAITAQAGDGHLAGRFLIQPQAEDSPFTVSIRFSDVQADKIVTEAGGLPGTVTGKLEGHLDATGKTADPNALSGAGEIILRDGQVRQYSLLSALGQLLQIQELQQLKLSEALVKYHIDPGVITIDQLVFRSENIRLTATGTVSFEGKLQLESQLAVNEKMRSQLFRAIRDNFKPIDDPGYTAVSFQVSGTVGRPKTNLMDKLIGRDLKDLTNVLSGFLGGGKSEKKKKPADETATPSPTSAPSASP
ncbi:MAG TPA: AsmA-like C-terminal region-containing protein [Chthoniobacterales bacterium]|nr:AsmA-like C-terminal region-containing protein [Chthoniobacterales bacterium]